MIKKSRGSRKLRRSDILLGTSLAVLSLVVWRGLRPGTSTSRNPDASTFVPARVLLRSAHQEPDSLPSLVSGGRFSTDRAAPLLSDGQEDNVGSNTSSAESGAEISPARSPRVWEYLLKTGATRNVGHGLQKGQAWQARHSDHQYAQLASSNNAGAQQVGSREDFPAQNQTLGVGEELPEAFDWQTYLQYSPDLSSHGIATEEQAQRHYLDWGRGEHRLYHRLRVLLRYTACTGLINQHYSHIAAFTLAAAVHAELVLAPAVQRDSFGHYFSQDKDQNEVQWAPAPLDSLLDVALIIEAWAARGITVHKTPALLPFPDLTEPQGAFPLYPQPEVDQQYIARIDNIYLQNLELGELADRVRSTVVAHAQGLMQKQGKPDAHPPYVVVDLPCTFFMLATHSCMRLVSKVARSLRFAPQLEQLAGRIVANMSGLGSMPFNGAHLRLERDAKDWSVIMGGEEVWFPDDMVNPQQVFKVIWDRYVQAMQEARFSEAVGVYVASGLLTYGANQEMAVIEDMLKRHGLCSGTHYKEMYLATHELEGLTSEQKALVDFLVLARSATFVGFGSSTFSFYLREFRALSGINRTTSVLVDASVIGTDPLFQSAGVVV